MLQERIAFICAPILPILTIIYFTEFMIKNVVLHVQKSKCRTRQALVNFCDIQTSCNKNGIFDVDMILYLY